MTNICADYVPWFGRERSRKSRWSNSKVSNKIFCLLTNFTNHFFFQWWLFWRFSKHLLMPKWVERSLLQWTWRKISCWKDVGITSCLMNLRSFLSEMTYDSDTSNFCWVFRWIVGFQVFDNWFKERIRLLSFRNSWEDFVNG